MREFGLFINGVWRASSGDQYFESKNPATGDVVAVFPKATQADVNAAVTAAQEALVSWRKVPPASRGAILFKAAQILRDRKDEVGKVVTTEMGKVLAEGKGDVQEAIDFFEYIAGEGRRLLGETSPSELPNKIGMTFRQPLGVVGAITPWNFPVAIPAWKIGAALITGNTIVHKPASQTPYCAALLVEALVEAGLPKGVLNLVTGPATTVGRQIVEHPATKAISFTGGVPQESMSTFVRPNYSSVLNWNWAAKIHRSSWKMQISTWPSTGCCLVPLEPPVNVVPPRVGCCCIKISIRRRWRN